MEIKTNIFVLIAIQILIILCILWLNRIKISLVSTNKNDIKLKNKSEYLQEKRFIWIVKQKNFIINILSVINAILDYCFLFFSLSLIYFDYNPLKNIFGFYTFNQDHETLLIILQIIATFLIIFISSELGQKMIRESEKTNIIKKNSLIIYFICKSIIKIIPAQKILDNIDNQEITTQIDKALNEENQVSDTNKEILKNILTFGDIEVSDIMTPRHDIVMVDKNNNFAELKSIILGCNFSRIPIYEKNLDNLLGIIYVKDLIKHIDEKDDFKWFDLKRELYFVPENKKISSLLKEFQKNKIHLCAVSDEYGGISGIATMEDILEEIVGEISDEFDDDNLNYQKIDQNTYLFDAKILINDFCKITNIDEEIFNEFRQDTESLAGIILEITGDFPQNNQTISYKNIDFTVKSFEKHRIQKVIVSINNK